MGDVQDSRRKNLELVRSARGETWRELAKVLGLTSSSYLSQIISGERAFTEKTARKFERKLGLRSEALDEDPTQVSGSVKHVETELLADVAFILIRMITQDKRLKLSDAQVRKISGMAVVQAIKDGSVNEEYIKQLVALAGSG